MPDMTKELTTSEVVVMFMSREHECSRVKQCEYFGKLIMMIPHSEKNALVIT